MMNSFASFYKLGRTVNGLQDAATAFDKMSG